MRGTLVATCVVILLMSEATSAFQETNKLLRSLTDVKNTATSTIDCPASLTDPNELAAFVRATTGLYQELMNVNARCSTINTVASTILLIPGVNYITSPVLGPLTISLTWIGRSISLITTATEPMVNTLADWKVPLQITRYNGETARNVLLALQTSAENYKTYLTQLATEISKVQCTVRSGYLQSLESTATGMDAVPNMVNEELIRADAVCREIQNFLVTTDAQINDDLLTSFQLARDGINLINQGFDPIQEYLDEVDRVLDSQICLHDVERITRMLGVEEAVDTVVDVGTDVVEEVKNIFSRWGRRRRRSAESLRKRRSICVSVRQVLDGAVAVDGGYITSAEYLLKDVFNRIMPHVPGVNNILEDLSATLLPFQTDFDLGGKAGQLLPAQTAVHAFVNQDYPSIFTNRPAQSEISESAPAVCSGEEALVV